MAIKRTESSYRKLCTGVIQMCSLLLNVTGLCTASNVTVNAGFNVRKGLAGLCQTRVHNGRFVMC